MHNLINSTDSGRIMVNCTHTSVLSRNGQTGALLLGLIITMVILSALGGGIVYIFSSSTLNPISGNYAQRAYYNAEAGFRYVTALYRVAGNKTVFNAYTTPQNITLPGGGTATVTVTGLSGTYTPATATATVSGSNLVLSAVTGTFPAAPGYFTKDGASTIYRYMEKIVDGGGNITLKGISPIITTNGTITTKEQATITSVGAYGSGLLWNVSRKITYQWPLTTSGSGTNPPELFDPTEFTGGKNPIYTPDTISGGAFTTKKNKSTVITDDYPYPGGGSYERTDLIISGFNSLGSGNNAVRYLYVPFKYSAAGLPLDDARSLNNDMLTYDVQVKIRTNPNVKYASIGFMFRAQQQDSGNNLYYSGYGISFMRYEDVSQSDVDFVPNSVKPTLAGGGTQYNRVLMVLWEQTGRTTWRWLAYKKLHLLSPGSRWDNWYDRTTSEVYDNWVRGSQRSDDGYFIHDDTTLMIRVIEKMVDGARTNDIQLFFSDWSLNQNGRTQDTNAYNVMTNRFGYHRSVAEPLWKWPSLPDISSSYWNATENDWFTAVTWDRVNTNSAAALIADEAGINSVIRDNGHTSANFSNQTATPEFVFHTFGNLTSSLTVHFTDFGVRLLKGGGSASGATWVGAIQQ